MAAENLTVTTGTDTPQAELTLLKARLAATDLAMYAELVRGIPGREDRQQRSVRAGCYPLPDDPRHVRVVYGPRQGRHQPRAEPGTGLNNGRAVKPYERRSSRAHNTKPQQPEGRPR
jgi:hypothetical protein